MTTAPSQAYSTNSSLSDLARWLGGRNSVAVITHAKPDGDAIGSTIAAARAINIAAGGSGDGFGGVASKAEVWFAGPMPPWAGAIVQNTRTRPIGADHDPPGLDPDAILVTDTGAWSQLADYRAWLESNADRVAIIDHHLRGDAEIGSRRVIEPSAAAACELVADLCRELLGVRSCAELPREVAEPLYLGLATDTGWFKHSNVTPATLRLAADLLETGLDHERLFETVEQRDRPARMLLLARALASLEYHNDETLALMTLTQKDFVETGASQGDSGGFLDIVRSVASVRVAALLTELGSGDDARTKLSLRSKGGPDMVDVNAVAASLGGGGHAQAAGARMAMPLTEAREKVLGALS
ncbi:MAG: DHH family phosphoesterase [Planctomycetota bacterium]